MPSGPLTESWLVIAAQRPSGLIATFRAMYHGWELWAGGAGAFTRTDYAVPASDGVTLGLFGTGAYMTSETTFPWTWSTGWIQVGIAALVVLGVQGGGVAERTAKKLEAALHANGPGPLGPECRRLTLHPGLWVMEFSNFGLVFGVVWNMTQKPGLGGSLAAVLVGYAVGVALALLLSRAPQEELAAAGEAAG